MLDGLQLDHEEIGVKMQGLADWIRSDFNEWHALGVDQAELNPSLQFMLGIARLCYMRPWQWVTYFKTLISDLGMNLTDSLSALL